MAVLLDTNVVSELRKGTRCNLHVASWQKQVPLIDQYLSAIVLFELRLGIALKAQKDPTSAAVLLDWYDKQVKPSYTGRIIAVDARICERAALINVPTTRPFRDSLIAATAIEHQLTIVTRNRKDFDLMGAHVIDPWEAR
jgi:predicted nucleic acid-binding protein